MAPAAGKPAATDSPLPAPSASLPVQEIVLSNGFRLLLVSRPMQATVAAGWVVETGSFDDPVGAAGMSHLLEHLLFKGSRLIGTRSFAEERPLLEREDELTAELRRLASRGSRAEKQTELRRELEQVRTQATALARLGEFSLLYSEAGATDLNAHTFKDFAAYLVTVPAGKLEIWFWLESDRLLNPVLREFGKEAGIILEERRQRVESVPGGAEDAAFEEHFWGDSGYAHRPLGRPAELASIVRPEARDFFEQWFRADRLTAVLVGSFEAQRVRELGERYFGRLPKKTTSPPSARNAAPSPRTNGPPAPWLAECACATRLRVLYPAVPFGHPDSYPLQVLSGVLNGRAGRLHRSLVIEEEIARSARSRFQSYRHAGFFSVIAESKGGHSPERLLAAWDAELAGLIDKPLGELEIGRVKSQMAANAYRSLQDPANLRTQLLVYAGLGDWQEISRGPAHVLRVSAADVRRVAREYLGADRRSIAYFEGTSP
ncbi:MAG: M16 family metallopeptidase [Thermoanaerobaculia bacterium]